MFKLWNNCRDNIYVRTVAYSTSLTGSVEVSFSQFAWEETRETHHHVCEEHTGTTNFDLPGNCGINSHWHIHRGRYCLVPRVSHQASSTVQTIRYMEVSLYEASCSLIPCHQNYEIWPTVHLNQSSKHWTHFSKLHLMSLRHLDTPTWDERSLIVWSIHIYMTPLTTARHTSISEELDNIYATSERHPWSPRDWTRKPSTSVDTSFMREGMKDGREDNPNLLLSHVRFWIMFDGE